MGRLGSVLKVIHYKLRYGKALHWEKALFCERVADIKIVSGNLSIGKGIRMNPGSYIAVLNNGNVLIENNVSINRNTMIVCHNSITIKENCSIGPNVMIYDHDHCFNAEGIQKGYRTAPVVINKNCWIGGDVVILRGTTIGEGCVIGAGTVVKGDIPPHSLVTLHREMVITPIQNK